MPLLSIENANWHSINDLSTLIAIHSALEDGKLIYFPTLTFHVDQNESELLSPSFSNSKSKNISFNSRDDSLRGFNGDTDTHLKMKNMMSRFCKTTTDFIRTQFPHYAEGLQIGRTSFRPIEIQGRKSKSYKKDDTRLHVDAFPSTPNQGRRILRVFSNIHSSKPRVWKLGESFDQLAIRFKPLISKQLPGAALLLKKLKITKSLRTPYDHIMLQLHDKMKKDRVYQNSVTQQQVDLSPASTWIVFTDQVSHAALSGQHVLEQTFYLPIYSMKDENKSPLRILEKIMKRTLV